MSSFPSGTVSDDMWYSVAEPVQAKVDTKMDIKRNAREGQILRVEFGVHFGVHFSTKPGRFGGFQRL